LNVSRQCMSLQRCRQMMLMQHLLRLFDKAA
jgi:hypothetical protein